jgi:hypothetical protein
MGRRIAFVLAAAAAVAASMSTPAFAAPSGSTPVTFDILAAGGLDITVPSAAALPDGTPGASITGSLGTVTAADSRAALVGSWTVTATATNFTTGGATAAETIPVGSVSYWSGPATGQTGLGVVIPGQPLAANAVALSTTPGVTAFSKLVGAGSNSASWNPTLVVTVPASAVAGTYTGTVTHSIA